MDAAGPANATMRKFGYPDSLVADYAHWAVLLRPAQATLGALVLAARGPATAFSGLSDAAFAELAVAVRAAEAALRQAFSYEKINYLMLMMVDPHVHFHVLPRYSQPRLFGGATFLDPGWPGPPQLAHAPELGDALRETLRDRLRALWGGGPDP